MQLFFCNCILQGAIDFAVLLYVPTPRGTSQPTVQLFKQLFLQAAIDFAVMR